MAPVNLEKTNLEIHVEMSKLRDTRMQEDINESKKEHAELKKLITDLTDKLSSDIKEVANDLAVMKEDRNNQLIKWGTAIILSLISALGLIGLRIILPAILAKGSQ